LCALPIAAILTVWLCARRRWSTAIWYAVAVLGCRLELVDEPIRLG